MNNLHTTIDVINKKVTFSKDELNNILHVVK